MIMIGITFLELVLKKCDNKEYQHIYLLPSRYQNIHIVMKIDYMCWYTDHVAGTDINCWTHSKSVHVN